MNSLIITDIRARAVVAPLPRPVRTASGSVDVSPLILLDVVTDQSITGHAYLFGYTPVTLKPLMSLLEQIKPDLIGKSCVPLARMQQMEKRFRLLGLQGLLGMLLSISASVAVAFGLVESGSASARYSGIGGTAPVRSQR